MEQVYVIYFGNIAGSPEAQALIDSLRPSDMPIIKGISANRMLPMSEPMRLEKVDILPVNFLTSLIKSHLKTTRRPFLEETDLRDIYEQYEARYQGAWSYNARFKAFVRRFHRRELKSLGVQWSSKGEHIFKKYWPVLYAINTFLTSRSLIRGPIDGFYRLLPSHIINWDEVSQTAQSLVPDWDHDLYIAEKCKSWWRVHRSSYGDLIFFKNNWDSVTGDL
jgi:hypothetical protein